MRDNLFSLLEVRDYKFSLVEGPIAVDLIAKHHYTHSCSGVQYKYSFGAWFGTELHGAALFGQTAMPTTWKRYAKHASELIELRRLVFIDSAPRNIESRFIAYCLRELRKLDSRLKRVLSYADPHFGHAGTIYKASNFRYLGTTAKCRMIDWKGKLRHSKSLQAGRKTEIRPYSFAIRAALKTGEAKYITRPGKHIYLYELFRD